MKTGGANWVVPLAGAFAGGIAGHFLFVWIARQGFYALVLPGALIGCVEDGSFDADRQHSLSCVAF